MSSDTSMFQPEMIAAKLEAVASLRNPELSKQFKTEPRLAEAIWFIEAMGRQPRGTRGLFEDLVVFAGEEIMPGEFLKLPVDRRGRFSPEDVFTVWRNLPAPQTCPPEFKELLELIHCAEIDDLPAAEESGISEAAIGQFRDWLTRSRCIKACTQYVQESLEQTFIDFISDPEMLFPNTAQQKKGWGRKRAYWRLFENLQGTLISYMDAHAGRTLKQIAQTRVAKIVNEAMDYAWENKLLVTIFGDSRYGKTDCLSTWCDAYPGRARRVRTPANGGIKDLLLAIGEAIGIPVGYGTSTAQIKEKLQYILRRSGLLLAFDESQFLLPATFTATTSPARLNFVRTEIVDAKLPCVLASTPQAHRQSFKSYTEKTKYAMEQWLGRIDMNFNCPEEFTTEDMIEVARIRLPGISEKSIRLIVARAMQSEQLLHAMTAIATRAKWLAGKSGRTEPSQADIDRASNEFLKGVCASSETLEIPPSEDKAEKEGSRRPRPPRLAATGPPAIGAGRVTFEKSENVLA